MTPTRAALVRCPSCAFENQRDARGCFLCGQSLAGAEPVVARARPGGLVAPASRVAAAVDRQPPFRLTSVMLLVALIAVFFGVMQMSYGLGVLFAFPAVIALGRTLAVAEKGDSWLSRVGVFMTTLAAVVVTAMAGFAAFFTMCGAMLGTGRSGLLPGGPLALIVFPIGVLFCVMAGVLVAGVLRNIFKSRGY